MIINSKTLITLCRNRGMVFIRRFKSNNQVGQVELGSGYEFDRIVITFQKKIQFKRCDFREGFLNSFIHLHSELE